MAEVTRFEENPDTSEERPYITVSQIIHDVCEYYGVMPSEIKGKSRKQPLTRHRQVVCYLAKCLTRLSYPAIGRLIGGRDHSTIIYACDVITGQIQRDPDLKRDLDYLVWCLTGGEATSETVVDHLTLLRLQSEMEAVRAKRSREQRLARIQAYLCVRRNREEQRRLLTMTDDELLSYHVANYSALPERERWAA